MSYKHLGTFTTASDAISQYATPTAGAPHWRGKVGLVTGVADPKNRLNPLMQISFRWDIEGNQLPREDWQIPLLSLGRVPGFLNQLKEANKKQEDELIAALGSIDIGNLEVSMTCERCALPFDPDPDNMEARICPECRKDLSQ